MLECYFLMILFAKSGSLSFREGFFYFGSLAYESPFLGLPHDFGALPASGLDFEDSAASAAFFGLPLLPGAFVAA